LQQVQVHDKSATTGSGLPRRRCSRFIIKTLIYHEGAGLLRRRCSITKALQHYKSAAAGLAVNSVQKRYNKFNNKFKFITKAQ